MKNLNYSLFFIAFLFLGGMIFSSCQKEPVLDSSELLTLEETDVLQAKPKVKFKIGVKLRLWKPSRNCNGGWGICELTAIFINIDWTQGICDVDVGADTGRGKLIVVYNSNFEEIEAIVANDPLMHIEEGDQEISVDEETLADLGLSAIHLIPGDYEVFLNEDGKFQVEIDAELIE